MKEKKAIINRSLLLFVPMILLGLGVGAKLLHIQFGEGRALRAQADQEVIRQMPVPAERGNIFSSDGRLLATTVPVYDIHFDPISVEADHWEKSLAGLARALAQMPGLRSEGAWLQYLRQARAQGNRYLFIAEDLNYTQLQLLRSYPIFERGRFKGGLVVEQENERKKPLHKMAERTIGQERRYSSTGLEGAFASYLKGHDGLRLKQKLSEGNWKPISESYEVAPQDGYDLRSTIDTRMQDIVHHELLKALELYEADHGTAVLMEVKTGAIRAIANLGRTEQGTYFERRNYAVWESTEPGSTFKLASVMALLEDGLVDTSDLVDTEGGVYTLYDRKIRDSNWKGYGTISLKRAFELSSNVGLTKLVYQNYGDQPQRFVDRLYAMGLHRPLGLPIRGEGQPKIPQPGDREWSGVSLAWMSFGYQVSLTPLQLLSFYNGVANDGLVLRPRLVESIERHGQPLERFGPEALNPALCSPPTLRKLQDLLRGVVTNGTATNINSPLLPLAGKTGTCQLNYWKENTNEYQASFVGYFPADAPRYSCIVVINRPNYHRGYYGSTVAAPVFRNIAERVHRSQPRPWRLERPAAASRLEQASTPLWQEPLQRMPDLRGRDGSEVLSRLENAGFEVLARGAGKVRWQYPPAGSALDRSRKIEISLG